MEQDRFRIGEKKALKAFASAAFWVLLQAIVVASCAYQIGKTEGAYEQRRKSECSCGNVRTCAFGVGIVGEQKCEPDRWDGNRWGRCEPRPFQP